MEAISVIVPIFHGKKYIDNIIEQIEKCAVKSVGKCTLELLLINDDPSEQIGSFSSEIVDVKVIETDKNRGIHGARVRGLDYCRGDYVLFLDQDDRIYPDYFNSQLAYLADKDAVVCKLLHEGRQFYDNRMPFEKVINGEYIVGVKNPIISPGQVLLRKDRIPKIWTKLELKNNGADDWLLWLCMIAKGQEFALNPELLFEHVMEGENESINVKHMMDSEAELYEAVKANGILTGQELEKLHDAVEAVAAVHIGILVKFHKMFFVYDTWLRLQEEDVSISAYLRQRGVYSIAVYGYNQIGKRLYHTLSKEGVCVNYFIDMNAEYLKEEIPIYQPEAVLPQVDMIIISLVEAVDSIKEKLSHLTKIKVCGIMELLGEMKIFSKSHLTGEDKRI